MTAEEIFTWVEQQLQVTDRAEAMLAQGGVGSSGRVFGVNQFGGNAPYGPGNEPWRPTGFGKGKGTPHGKGEYRPYQADLSYMATQGKGKGKGGGTGLRFWFQLWFCPEK